MRHKLRNPKRNDEPINVIIVQDASGSMLDNVDMVVEVYLTLIFSNRPRV